MFLFMVVIVLLSTLIAQVSDTYTKVLSTAEGVHLFYRCAYITMLEKRKSQCIEICWRMLLAKCTTCLKGMNEYLESHRCNCFTSVSLLYDSLSLLGRANVSPILLSLLPMFCSCSFYVYWTLKSENALSMLVYMACNCFLFICTAK